MEYRICTKCLKKFPLEEKYFRKRTDRGTYRTICKECERENRRINYEKNKEIIKAKVKKYREENKEKVKETKKKYTEKNAENIKKKQKQYYESNKRKLLSQNKEYYKNNKDKIRSKQKEYRDNNLEKIKAKNKKWRNDNKEHIRILNNTRRYKIRKTICTLSKKQWEESKKYFQNKCAYCGKEKKLTQDHFIPVAKGGDYTKNNIIPCCFNCNCSKQDNDFSEWYIKQKFYSKERENKIYDYFKKMLNN